MQCHVFEVRGQINGYYYVPYDNKCTVVTEVDEVN